MDTDRAESRYLNRLIERWLDNGAHAAELPGLAKATGSS
jgi:hypothetical protein